MGHANLYTTTTGHRRTLRAEDAANVRCTVRSLTCRLHRRWLHDCIAHAAVIPSGYAGARAAPRPVVAVDELLDTVTVTCPNCGETAPHVAPGR